MSVPNLLDSVSAAGYNVVKEANNTFVENATPNQVLPWIKPIPYIIVLLSKDGNNTNVRYAISESRNGLIYTTNLPSRLVRFLINYWQAISDLEGIFDLTAIDTNDIDVTYVDKDKIVYEFLRSDINVNAVRERLHGNKVGYFTLDTYQGRPAFIVSLSPFKEQKRREQILKANKAKAVSSLSRAPIIRVDSTDQKRAKEEVKYALDVLGLPHSYVNKSLPTEMGESWVNNKLGQSGINLVRAITKNGKVKLVYF